MLVVFQQFVNEGVSRKGLLPATSAISGVAMECYVVLHSVIVS